MSTATDRAASDVAHVRTSRLPTSPRAEAAVAVRGAVSAAAPSPYLRVRGDELRRARERLGLEVPTAAARAGIFAAEVEGWEADLVPLSLGRFLLYLEELLAGDGPDDADAAVHALPRFLEFRSGAERMRRADAIVAAQGRAAATGAAL